MNFEYLKKLPWLEDYYQKSVTPRALNRFGWMGTKSPFYLSIIQREKLKFI